ncbi:lipopolysaccharide kinase InaA family protein [Coraliomargarita sp. W4R72]
MFKTKHLWTDSSIKPMLEAAGLLDIESVSQREFDWFEAPNRRRGGWSGVSRIVLNPDAPVAEQKAVFLKIQQNHFYIAPNTYLRKRLTFEREFAAIQALRPHCSALPQAIMFAKWQENGNQGSILVTEALDNWTPLDKWQLGQLDTPAPDTSTLHRALEAIARTAREINQAGWIHMCFSAKHLFVKETNNQDFAVRVVDLEKTRQRIGLNRRTIKDCSHFLRHTPKLSDANKVHFLKAYFQTESFTAAQKALISKMRGAPKV